MDLTPKQQKFSWRIAPRCRPWEDCTSAVNWCRVCWVNRQFSRNNEILAWSEEAAV